MNSLLDDDDDVERTDRELTLSTGTILGIFLGLALLCGLFFGFGYKMGSHKAGQQAQTTSVDNSPAPAATFNSFKPPAGSPAGDGAAAGGSNASDSGPTHTPSERSSAASRHAAEAAHERTAAVAAPVDAVAAPAGAGGIVVQVAAVSHQQDAELLVNALRAKGYPVSAHTEPQDKFFHIQVGPFTSRKDADVAKQRLLADGYQPIVK